MLQKNHYWLWWDFEDFNVGVLYDSLVIHPISQKYCISLGFSLAMLLWHKLSCHFFHTKWRLILFILTGQIVKHWLWLGRPKGALNPRVAVLSANQTAALWAGQYSHSRPPERRGLRAAAVALWIVVWRGVNLNQHGFCFIPLSWTKKDLF